MPVAAAAAAWVRPRAAEYSAALGATAAVGGTRWVTTAVNKKLDAPVDFTCINWTTVVSSPCHFHETSILPLQSYYKIFPILALFASFRRRSPIWP
eukprot:COSAG01_NODE_47544_length_389_cov_0.972414_1_plen_95_part_10